MRFLLQEFGLLLAAFNLIFGQTENSVHLLLVNRSCIHQIVGTCLWHVRPVSDNVQKPNLLHMPKACPYD